jgi:hypothetical protein
MVSYRYHFVHGFKVYRDFRCFYHPLPPPKEGNCHTVLTLEKERKPLPLSRQIGEAVPLLWRELGVVCWGKKPPHPPKGGDVVWRISAAMRYGSLCFSLFLPPLPLQRRGIVVHYSFSINH